jgi:SNF2 family DNA or RNA helicase
MMSKLQSVLGTLVYGRKKVDVLPDLPAKIVTDIPYRLNPSHAKAYNKLKKNLALELEDGSEAYFDSALAVTSKLRTLCNAPTLLGSTGESAKTEIIAELVDELMDDDRKVVIFTWHKDYAKYLTMRLYMWGTVLVTGDQDSIERDRLVQRFRQNEESHLLIATIGSVGTGMELQEATAAIFAEGSYTPAHNLQAEDRLHRIGIHDSPLIYRLWARGTVEEALWSTNDDRIAQADDMLNLRSVMERAMQMEAVSA